jgi:HAD superfamily hydrolase (TIGR01509 family)
LFDYGGTLVEEVSSDLRAGTESVLARASHRPPDLDAVFDRATRVTEEIANRRNEFQIETPWTSLNRLIHDYFGTQFSEPPESLALAFWDAAVTTRAMPGAREALDAFHRRGLSMGVVSNSSFGAYVIRHELAKHGLTDHLQVIVVSAEYVVRKPNPLLFETAAALIGLSPADIWFVGDSFDTDIAGARAAGMTSVWYNPGADDQREGADLVVPGWDALQRALDER